MSLKKNLIKFNEVFLLTLKKNRRNKWIQNFILGSRNNNWEVLNFMEVIKKLEALKPFIKQILHNQGTILIIMINRFNFLQKYFYLFINYLPLFETVVFLDHWRLGSLSNYNHIRFINVRQLPSVIFLFSLNNSRSILSEALNLRIPVVSLVDSRYHFDYISKYIYFPIPLGNSLLNIYFLLSYLKNIILNYYKYTNNFNLSSYLYNAFLRHSKKNEDNDKILNNFRVFAEGFNKGYLKQIIFQYYNQYNPNFLAKELKGLEDDFKELNFEKDSFLISRRSFDDRFLLLNYLKLKESVGLLKKVKRAYNYSFYLFDERYRLAYLRSHTIGKLNKDKNDYRNFYNFWFDIAKKRVGNPVLEEKRKKKKPFRKNSYEENDLKNKSNFSKKKVQNKKHGGDKHVTVEEFKKFLKW